jgi:hypothetical protein
MELTDLPSTATMISPRTMLPAKPLPVGARPALAAALPPGTYDSRLENGDASASKNIYSILLVWITK